ncbi:ROK family protein [Flammeovirga agarivorans]|uniref:ROK family protein n=1 Tax=Flammeovirga agarivorans TaxID=2726742 RepID=A0A7X8SM13_9BACT|nr:ROK family protein [Flammeovirga agarivorans]NLR92636.1 ROK family protein [Flammeovirga agarivorans]
MKQFLGVDIGGTNVKFGVVDADGNIVKKKKYPTIEVSEGGDFCGNFSKLLAKRLKKFPDIASVGIGIPGTISADGKSTLDLPNVPALANQALVKVLEKDFPTLPIVMDNDANAAALGELEFGLEALPKTYIFITLGTGVGGGCVINGKIFKGGDGNGFEVGHVMSSTGKTIEQNIGKAGIIAMAKKYIAEGQIPTTLSGEFDAKAVANAAHEGDKLALQVYHDMGKYVGELIVTLVRVLDIKTILIGGGVSETFDYLKLNMYSVINEFLPEYYTKDLNIQLATLGNNAGILGAASLGISGIELK